MSEVAAKGCQDTNNDKNEKEDHKLTGQRQKKTAENIRLFTHWCMLYNVCVYVLLCRIHCKLIVLIIRIHLRNVGSQKFWPIDCKKLFQVHFYRLGYANLKNMQS